MPASSTHVVSTVPNTKRDWRSEWDKYTADHRAMMEQYAGTEYADMLNKNPYASYQDYAPSIWDKIGEVFGLTSGWTDFYNQRQNSMNEWDAQIAALAQANKHNSPENQAALDAAAGLNPNLAGKPSEAGAQSGPIAPDDTPPPSSAETKSNGLQELSGFFMDAASSLMSFGSWIQQYKGLRLANNATDIKNTKDAWDELFTFGANLSGEPIAYGADYDEDGNPVLTVEERVMSNIEKALQSGKIKRTGLSSRARAILKQFKGQIAYDENGKPTVGYARYREQFIKDLMENRRDAGKAYGEGLRSGDIETSLSTLGNLYNEVTLWTTTYQATVAKIDSLLEQKYRERERAASVTKQESESSSASAQADYDEGYYTSELGESDREIKKLENQRRDIQFKAAKEIDTLFEPRIKGANGFEKIILIDLREKFKNNFFSGQSVVEDTIEGIGNIGSSILNNYVSGAKTANALKNPRTVIHNYNPYSYHKH